MLCRKHFGMEESGDERLVEPRRVERESYRADVDGL